jgi:cobalt-zinc-cadmium efflux system protein
VPTTFAHVAHHHPHDHHDHAHHRGHAPAASGFALAFVVNLVFAMLEAVGGWWTDSIAVLTDAVHDLGDALVLGTAWYLQRVAARGRDARYSYGYGRYSLLGGWLTSAVLITGALFMLATALPRLWLPELPDTRGMVWIAIFGLVANGLAAWKLHGGHSLNQRGAYLHLLEDVLGWAAVLVGAAVMHFTGWAVVDPLLSMGISLFILYNAIGTLRTGTRILMQAQPTNVDEVLVRERLLALPDVRGIHDQHSWTLDGSYIVHTVHLLVNEIGLERARALKVEARQVLHGLGIQHATIELEWPGDPCTLHDH